MQSKLTASQIITFCKQKLHDWKYPKKIVFLDEIPRNTMGKILKEAVKKNSPDKYTQLSLIPVKENMNPQSK